MNHVRNTIIDLVALRFLRDFIFLFALNQNLTKSDLKKFLLQKPDHLYNMIHFYHNLFLVKQMEEKEYLLQDSIIYTIWFPFNIICFNKNKYVKIKIVKILVDVAFSCNVSMNYFQVFLQLILKLQFSYNVYFKDVEFKKKSR